MLPPPLDMGSRTNNVSFGVGGGESLGMSWFSNGFAVPRVIIAFFISGFFEFEVSHDLALYC
jgi:hypothetical protein